MWILVVATFALLASGAHTQPASCVEDSQCKEGFYCEPNAHICLECLNCADYLRKLRPTNECIKTIGDCGPCLEGLVGDHRGDLQCLPPEEAEGTSYYIWGIVVGVLLVFIFLIVVVSVYIFKGNILKISTRTLLRPSCPSMEGTAPDPPPPYNPYSPVRTDPPPFNSHQLHYVNTQEEDPSETFVKQVPSSHRLHNIESEENQNARVFNRPAYMRHRPPSPDITTDLDDNFSPIQDENTTESTWTPTTDSNNANNKDKLNENATNGNVEGSSDLPTLLAAARDTTLVEPPPKRTKVHDTNNNGNTEDVTAASTSSSAHIQITPTPAPAPAPAPAMYLNIQVNNTLGTSYTGQINSMSR